MSTTTNRRFLLASRPDGAASTANFRLDREQLRPLADGEFLVRNHFLSLDPYMRGRMDERRSYAEPQPLDAVMIGGTVGEVVDSRSTQFATGDRVVGMGGWQEYTRVAPAEARAWNRLGKDGSVPMSAYLGPVGMPGVTAWYGLERIIAPKAGETIVVSAASGAVGSVVGQLAKARGCRAVGIAGGPDKCRYVVDELGFDACVDHKAHRDLKSMAGALKEAAPDGVDGCFENVGGLVLDAVMLRMNPFSRIALCGVIAGYDGAPIPMTNPSLLLVNRMKLEGFIVSEHPDAWPQALGELRQRVAQGTLKYRESIAEGIESAPQAFLDLLAGKNFGKQLVRLV